MNKLKKPPLWIGALALTASLAACDGSGSPSPANEPATSDAVVVNSTASVDAVDEAGIAAVDPTLTSPIVVGASSEQDHTRVSLDPKNPRHAFGASALQGNSPEAAKFYSFKAFTENRAGDLTEVKAKGFTWAYVGSEADGKQYVPLAGVVARAEDDSVFVCMWTGNYADDASAAKATAKANLPAIQAACEVHAS